MGSERKGARNLELSAQALDSINWLWATEIMDLNDLVEYLESPAFEARCAFELAKLQTAVNFYDERVQRGSQHSLNSETFENLRAIVRRYPAQKRLADEDSPPKRVLQ
jgi:hypothetical protein